jgi:hypothetical protein
MRCGWRKDRRLKAKQRRILKLLALQERRLLAETANCAETERRLLEISDHMQALGQMLERDDCSMTSLSGLVLDRLSRSAAHRQETQIELENRRAAAQELKRQIKRIDKLAEQLDTKMRDEAAQKEKKAILERFSSLLDVSAK